jgi:hypothetical protein
VPDEFTATFWGKTKPPKLTGTPWQQAVEKGVGVKGVPLEVGLNVGVGERVMVGVQV